MDSSIESMILDSSASFQSSPNKELFRNFKFGNFEKVYLEIKGKGDVRYIPGLKKNLISIGQLDSTGYATELEKSSW